MIEDRRAYTPHKSSRRGTSIRYIILHADASPKAPITEGWLAHPDAQASYHVLIDRDGTSIRFVEDDENAWHAGQSKWGELVGLNRHSLGLAFANRQDGKEALTPEQLVTACRWVLHWRILYPTIEDVLTHAMVAPARRRDPAMAPNFTLRTFREPWNCATPTE